MCILGLVFLLFSQAVNVQISLGRLQRSLAFEFMPTEMWIVIGIESFKGKKSLFFYRRFKMHLPWNFVETPGTRSRKARKVNRRVWHSSPIVAREIHVPQYFQPSFTILSAFSGSSPTVLNISPMWRGLILLG